MGQSETAAQVGIALQDTVGEKVRVDFAKQRSEVRIAASITASATLYSFSLARGSSWRPEGSRGNLDGYQDRREHRARFLPEKPLCRGRAVRTCEEKVVHGRQARALAGVIESS